MGSMTVKFKAPNLDAVANEFEDNAKRAEENSKRKGIPQKTAAVYRSEAYTWRQAADFLRNTELEDQRADDPK
jgi:hypothetical protein